MPSMFEECFGSGPFIFRINENGTGPQLLTQVCLERGWREYTSENDNWNLWWRTTGFPVSHHRSIYAWQYLNHIPKGAAICRKDNLVRYLRCMKKVYGSIYDFSPHGYNLPLEYTKLAAECSRGRDAAHKYLDEKPIWICKPVAQSQGRGIFLFRKLSELNYDTNTIVQRYIDKPLLIGGYKFDLRLYVCIPSYHPVTIYMYREGLARFGTDKFSLNDLRNPFRHLTNYSINKLGPGYTEMKDRVGSGCKWTLRQLRRYFQQAGISDWLLWQRITSLVILTVLSHVNQIPPTVNCFEFFGFDVLIDSSLRPWLLEVNLSPALSNDCDADRLVKKPMLHDMFDLLGLPLYNTGLSVFDIFSDEPIVTTSEEDLAPTKLTLKSTISVVNAAGRWRRKHKKMSASHSSRSNSAIRSKSRTASTANQKTYMNLPKVQVDGRNLGQAVCNVAGTKFVDEESKKHDYKNWGNGRNWRFATPREGGWVRIWPIAMDAKSNDLNDSNSNGYVKNMVNKVIKFTKTAKDLARKHPSASESQLSEFLQDEMDITGDIWIPPI
ncbi:probable tubulin polyglutamylase TTLL2 [Anoplophora glabripennis]|uniref:probable tubulin polyglutamylase TTLL2 n=1 Tax=Anoplophora glabripennis TaxID=217634 RepID=UPI0008754124|nr:probable tubulin polyglutamylase TTLL2 [Anoplophora glabripennis]